jgi:hypothetical protein
VGTGEAVVTVGNILLRSIGAVVYFGAASFEMGRVASGRHLDASTTITWIALGMFWAAWSIIVPLLPYKERR